MSLYGMDANINQTDGLQQAFANRVASISDRNQDILSKWQEGQKTKIEEDTVKQYGDQAIGVGETVEQLAGAGATAKNYLANKKQMIEDKIEQGNRRRRNRKRRIRREAGEDGANGSAIRRSNSNIVVDITNAGDLTGDTSATGVA